MSEEKSKREINNAINTLRRQWGGKRAVFKVIKIADPSCPFHLEVFRDTENKGDEVFKIRITIDRITDKDIKLCQEYKMPCGVFTKLIACKTGRGEFEYREIN